MGLMNEVSRDISLVVVLCLQARLPKGIENIRPHIEKVDNVPLLVSLFTDCTTNCE